MMLPVWRLTHPQQNHDSDDCGWDAELTLSRCNAALRASPCSQAHPCRGRARARGHGTGSGTAGRDSTCYPLWLPLSFCLRSNNFWSRGRSRGGNEVEQEQRWPLAAAVMEHSYSANRRGRGLDSETAEANGDCAHCSDSVKL